MRVLSPVRMIGLAAATAVVVALPLGAAGAAPYPGGGSPPEVAPTEVGAQVASKTATQRSTSSATLPFTGTDAAELALIGVGAVGVGVVLVRRSRRSAVS